MKIAIIINGNLRTIDRTKSNIIEQFSRFSPDYYVSTYNLQYGYHPCNQQSLNYYDDILLSIEQIRKYYSEFNPIEIVIDELVQLNREYASLVNKFHDNMKLFSSHYLQYYKIFKVVESIKNYENVIGQNYDYIIKIRPDIIYKNIDSLELGNNIILADKNVFPNDCIIATKRDYFIKMMTFIMNEYYSYTNPISNVDAPHGVVASSLLNLNIPIHIYDVMDKVVRVNMDRIYPKYDSVLESFFNASEIKYL